MLRRKFFLAFFLVTLILFCGLSLIGWVYTSQRHQAQILLQNEIQSVIDQRIDLQTQETTSDLFGEDDLVSILLLGLDARAGSDVAHCDVIQFIELNRKNDRVRITAIPRGTFALLPEAGHVPSDYYVSNACAIGGLEYGMTQIEQILGKQTDYVVMVGFSKALGIFRLLQLPTTETLQWLRARHAYAIGEPQRAHNHSTFLKQLLTQDTISQFTALEYILYKLVDTDLTFSQAQELSRVVVAMELSKYPERVELSMKPEYLVQEVAYDPEMLTTFLESPFNPPEGASKEEIQQEIIDIITMNLHDPILVERMFEQQLWWQLEDASMRESMHFTLLETYLSQKKEEEERQTLLADYIIEMEALGETNWAERGRALLTLTF
ncbi:hypothetical protein COV05_00845 [Candidatus Uhrbacteria bacterium CG10_big_fil_rev_8_21_14_0_10_48_16]|uniref:Cell envelope-related transcriptional attenuator domain-containing protein n=1 Tax=Candidatus Uhrbacteria bacterium CG10_big_fil_rev_8_21_14_0_10_48_16 TaxID=1975038 RepID=A0A2M8LI74_9BACT|nr:MAG: hypothetical protein COV05_00845 [Candidatus Uhrbacteria bacterium CG10_big_fil_rev_8_21_14_0_10_48_16]